MHAYAKTAAACIAMITPLICHIMLRLPFGASAAPALWCLVFEMVIDLSNKLICSPYWDPSKNYAPEQHWFPAPIHTPCPPEGYPSALPVEVDIGMDDKFPSGVEGYIDDGTAFIAMNQGWLTGHMPAYHWRQIQCSDK